MIHPSYRPFALVVIAPFATYAFLYLVAVVVYFFIPTFIPNGYVLVAIDFITVFFLLFVSFWGIINGMRLKKEKKTMAATLTIIVGILVSGLSAFILSVLIHISLYGFQY